MEYFTLNNGIKMPMAGIGLFLMSPAAEAEASVESALRSGVRLIDTAKLEPKESVLAGLPVEMRDAENGPAKAVEKWLKSLSILKETA